MQNFLNKIKEQYNKIRVVVLQIFNRWLVGSLILCFILCFGFILIIFGRYNALAQLRGEIARLQDSQEHSHWDYAYDNISFNIWWPMPIVKVQNLKIYSKFEPVREWNIKELQINTKTWDFHTLTINMSPEQNIVIGDNSYNIHMPIQNMNITYCIQKGIKEILLGIENLQIDGLANVSEIKFGAQRMAPQQVMKNSPLMETHLLINNIKFADELDIPLSSQIDKIYVNANMIGTMRAEETYQDSIYDWLAEGGKFEIENSTFEWKPLVMVSRGDLYFNEKLEPRLHLSASSRALIPVMDTLEDHGILDGKGVFVTRILLRNKAFKMSEKDEHDTVLTPIDYKDGQWSVENIPVTKLD